MRVTVLLFARLREIAGAARLVRDVPDGSTVGDVWDSLAAEWPGAAAHRNSVSAAVNLDFARFPTPVSDGDEVAFLPPVSGG